MFTPINISMNWDFIQYGFGANPTIIGNQYVIPANIAKTAPIDNT